MSYNNKRQYYYKHQSDDFYPSQQPSMPIGTVAGGKKLTSRGWVPYKKKSGAKEITTDKAGKRLVDRNGKPIIGVSAWMVSRSTGLISISGFSHYKSTWFSNAKGQEGVSIIVDVVYKDTGQKTTAAIAYNTVTGKAYLKELGIMFSTKGNNGGYCGKMQFGNK